VLKQPTRKRERSRKTTVITAWMPARRTKVTTRFTRRGRNTQGNVEIKNEFVVAISEILKPSR